MQIKQIDFIKNDIETIKNECKLLLPYLKPSQSTYVIGKRKEVWFERGWTLNQNITVFNTFHHRFFYKLGQKLFPNNHACLFLYYPIGSYIKNHRDHKVSEAKVVQLNLGSPVTFTIDGVDHSITEPSLIEFNSKQLHSVSPVIEDRFVISWRKIKSEHLNTQLKLF